MATEPRHKQVDLRDVEDFQTLLDGLQTLKHGPWKPQTGFSAEEYAAEQPHSGRWRISRDKRHRLLPWEE